MMYVIKREASIEKEFYSASEERVGGQIAPPSDAEHSEKENE